MSDKEKGAGTPLCAKCGLTRGALIHRPAEFDDDPGAEDCHRFVTGEFIEGESEPPAEPSRDEWEADLREERRLKADLQVAYVNACGENAALRERLEKLETLLRRINGWDHMDGAADGPFWRREIRAALSPSDPAKDGPA